jgi:mRNA interferase MazF
MITGNLSRQREPSHFLIDPTTPEGASSNLHGPSVASCNNIYTIAQVHILRVVGHLSDVLKQRLNDSLKVALQIP